MFTHCLLIFKWDFNYSFFGHKKIISRKLGMGLLLRKNNQSNIS